MILVLAIRQRSMEQELAIRAGPRASVNPAQATNIVGSTHAHITAQLALANTSNSLHQPVARGGSLDTTEHRKLQNVEATPTGTRPAAVGSFPRMGEYPTPSAAVGSKDRSPVDLRFPAVNPAFRRYNDPHDKAHRHRSYTLE